MMASQHQLSGSLLTLNFNGCIIRRNTKISNSFWFRSTEKENTCEEVRKLVKWKLLVVMEFWIIEQLLNSKYSKLLKFKKIYT